jgi:hypothetical protein
MSEKTNISNQETRLKVEQQLSPEAMARQELEAFVNNPGLAEMAHLFGAEELPEDSKEKLLALQKLAAEHWDFRKGAERQAVDWNDELLDQEGSEQWNIIFEAADKLGLVRDTDPTNKHPNSLVILGGANRAPLDRLRYGLDHVEDFDQVVYLGSTRPVTDVEREKAAEYAPDAQTEFDLGCGAFETLLGAKKVDEIIEHRNGDIWGMRLYEFESDGETKHGFVLSTPYEIGHGKRRATTYDNYRFFADRAELAKDPNHSVVAVTTGFYSAGQHMPGVQELTLKYGTKVETIGHSAEYSGVKRKPSQLLQETKSGIDAAVRLEQALETAKAA